MNQLKLSGGDGDTSMTFRDSYPFPSGAASLMTPSSPRLGPNLPLPFPFSHPENAGPRPARATPDEHVINTTELVTQIESTLDRMKSRLDDFKTQLDTYPFPGGGEARDPFRPRAA